MGKTMVILEDPEICVSEDLRFYLGMIQGCIGRMASYSCAFKGGCGAFLLALLALLQQAELTVAEVHFSFLAILLSALLFAMIDAYYLSLERRYRVRYAEVVDNKRAIELFDMAPPAASHVERSRVVDALFSCSVGGFYLSLGFLNIGLSVLLLV
ncbi:hypothetical protein COLINT_03297 [Collinsella intestinalis DSM 13280]|uniref:Uncharacterized protein n=1 Tax=Collinsella intestinalis DSM 13280 TaxID=521003 RepID=C4FB47_9ACTN|nr:hypothetical protein [Collinsella intestinalis]EEP44047.1 hypothetical protein COLINT_03297 [Collinsella intestinalis DSM 13280]